VQQANVTSREIGSKDIEDNNEKGHTTPNESPETQQGIMMTSRSHRTTERQGYSEPEKTEIYHKAQASKQREIRNK
jgi:hypothetical protein